MKFSLLLLALSASITHAQSFAGCTEADFVSASGEAVISIDGSGYTPKCLRVPAGTIVKIAASERHPLQGVGRGNPLFDASGGTEQPKTVQFNIPGLYGYFCIAHGDATGAGMAGAILVE